MSGKFTHRDRVLTALSRQQPDRVPVDFGGTKNSSIHVLAYERLKDRLGLSSQTRLIDRMMQAAEVEEAVLRRFDVDTRAVLAGSPDRRLGRDIDDESYQDEWGVIFRRPPGSYWYDPVHNPLAGEISLGTIANYPYPDPHDPGQVRGILPRIEELRRTTDCALVLYLPSAFIHKTQYLRGFEDWFVDVARDRALIAALFDAVLEQSMALAGDILAVAGHLVDVVNTSDDIGGQHGLLISPDAYRELIKPRQRAYFEFIRARTTAPILFHSCGSVADIIDDLIEIGVEAINPVQTRAQGMQAERLAHDFGDRICFWGGVDSQQTLPFGTPEEVQAEVTRCVRSLGRRGGYVLAAVHNIQPEVPPENIIAMFDAARAFPLTAKERRVRTRSPAEDSDRALSTQAGEVC